MGTSPGPVRPDVLRAMEVQRQFFGSAYSANVSIRPQHHFVPSRTTLSRADRTHKHQRAQSAGVWRVASPSAQFTAPPPQSRPQSGVLKRWYYMDDKKVDPSLWEEALNAQLLSSTRRAEDNADSEGSTGLKSVRKTKRPKTAVALRVPSSGLRAKNVVNNRPKSSASQKSGTMNEKQSKSSPLNQPSSIRSSGTMKKKPTSPAPLPIDPLPNVPPSPLPPKVGEETVGDQSNQKNGAGKDDDDDDDDDGGGGGDDDSDSSSSEEDGAPAAPAPSMSNLSFGSPLASQGAGSPFASRMSRAGASRTLSLSMNDPGNVPRVEKKAVDVPVALDRESSRRYLPGLGSVIVAVRAGIAFRDRESEKEGGGPDGQKKPPSPVLRGSSPRSPVPRFTHSRSPPRSPKHPGSPKSHSPGRETYSMFSEPGFARTQSSGSQASSPLVSPIANPRRGSILNMSSNGTEDRSILSMIYAATTPNRPKSPKSPKSPGRSRRSSVFARTPSAVAAPPADSHWPGSTGTSGLRESPRKSPRRQPESPTAPGAAGKAQSQRRRSSVAGASERRRSSLSVSSPQQAASLLDAQRGSFKESGSAKSSPLASAPLKKLSSVVRVVRRFHSALDNVHGAAASRHPMPPHSVLPSFDGTLEAKMLERGNNIYNMGDPDEEAEVDEEPWVDSGGDGLRGGLVRATGKIKVKKVNETFERQAAAEHRRSQAGSRRYEQRRADVAGSKLQSAY